MKLIFYLSRNACRIPRKASIAEFSTGKSNNGNDEGKEGKISDATISKSDNPIKSTTKSTKKSPTDPKTDTTVETWAMKLAENIKISKTSKIKAEKSQPYVIHDPKPYVTKVRLMDYWQQSDDALEAEIKRGRGIVMIDKEPLVKVENNSIKMVSFENSELQQKLNEYGLEIGPLNSILLDVIEPDSKNIDYRPLVGFFISIHPPPTGSGIDLGDVKQTLGHALGGRLISLRMAMLLISDEKERNNLARFQALTRWSKIYLRCPTCTTPLRTSTSKASSRCIKCDRVFYPNISPVAIVLIHDKENENCLLVRHRNAIGGVFTAVAGFSIPGETIEDTARREIAEELGIEVQSIKAIGLSQCWPMPNCSLMYAFTAVADKSHKFDISVDELESASWFSRKEVADALAKTEADPYFKGVKTTLDKRQELRYIPPRGAIAHQIIKDWVENNK